MGHALASGGLGVYPASVLMRRASESQRASCGLPPAGEQFKLDGWKYVEGHAKSGTLHLIGLLSDGGVHSRQAVLAARMLGVWLRRAPRRCCPAAAGARGEGHFLAGLPRMGNGCDPAGLLCDGGVRSQCVGSRCTWPVECRLWFGAAVMGGGCPGVGLRWACDSTSPRQPCKPRVNPPPLQQ